MFERLEIVPVPKVPLAEAGASIEAMRDSGLPAFVVRQAGNSRDAAFEALAGSFTDAGYQGGEKQAFGFTKREREDGSHDGDRDFHVDKRVTLGYASVISAHYTAEGAVHASFIEVKDPSIHKHSSRNLPTKQIADIKRGRVDTTVFVPMLHTADIMPNDMVVFRLAGEFPLAHEFLTTTWPRYSEAVDWHQDPEITGVSIIDRFLDSKD